MSSSEQEAAEARPEIDQHSINRRDTSLTTSTKDGWCVVQERGTQTNELPETMPHPRFEREQHDQSLPQDSEQSPAQSAQVKVLPDGSIVLSQLAARDLLEHAQRATRGHAVLLPIREQALLLRDQAGYQRSLCESKEDFVCETEESLADALHDTSSEAGTTAQKSLRESLREQLRKDRDDLRSQREVGRECERKVNRIEFRMQKPETAFATAAQSLVDLLRQWGLPGLDGLPADDAHSEQITHASQDLSADGPEPLLEQYYAAIEEVSFMRQHLVQIEAEHREARINRILREDQGSPETISDEEFEATYKEDYYLAEADFLEAVEKEQVARAACLEQGIDIGVLPDHLQDALSPPRAVADDAGKPYQTTALPHFIFDAAGPWEFAPPFSIDGDIDPQASEFVNTASPDDDARAFYYNTQRPSNLTQRVERWRQEAAPPPSERLTPLHNADAVAEMPNTPPKHLLTNAKLRRRNTVSSPERSHRDPARRNSRDQHTHKDLDAVPSSSRYPRSAG